MVAAERTHAASLSLSNFPPDLTSSPWMSHSYRWAGCCLICSRCQKGRLLGPDQTQFEVDGKRWAKGGEETRMACAVQVVIQAAQVSDFDRPTHLFAFEGPEGNIEYFAG